MPVSLHIYSPEAEKRCAVSRPSRKVLYAGQRLCIVVVTPEGQDACNAAYRHDAQLDPNGKVLPLLGVLGDRGKISSQQKFRYEGDGWWAIKPTDKIRLYGWYCTKRQGDFVIGHAAFKNQNKMNPADMNRLQSIKKIYERRAYGE